MIVNRGAKVKDTHYDFVGEQESITRVKEVTRASGIRLGSGRFGMAAQGGANVDLFDAYFRSADLDQDGRISGAEAVAFFQGSNLSKQVLAQRELTPDIVKAALYGPASAKIPAPQINLAATAAAKVNLMAPAPALQMGSTPTSSQNLGFRGQVPPNASMNQQYFPSQGNQSMRPPVPMPTGMASRPPQGVAGQDFPRGGMVGPGLSNSNMSNNWLGGGTSGAPTVPTSQVPNRVINPSMPSAAPNPQDSVSTTSLMATKDSKATVSSGNGLASDPMFRGDVFSVTQASPEQASSATMYSANSAPASSAIVPVTSGPQSSIKSDPLGSLTQSTGGQQKQTQSLSKPNQQVSAQITASSGLSGIPVEVGSSTSTQSQVPWPKMTHAGVQKYMKVFVEVDTDRDGKITGEQARNLFLSWRLPRGINLFSFMICAVYDYADIILCCFPVDFAAYVFCLLAKVVMWLFPSLRYLTIFCISQNLQGFRILATGLGVLKQVWDLSDQDNDSMLSLRVFCIALYLMERYREGWPLPSTLPSSILLDETLLSLAGVPNASYGNAAWGPAPGLRSQQRVPGSQPMTPTGLRPQMQGPYLQTDGTVHYNQQKAGVPAMENSHVNQLNSGMENRIHWIQNLMRQQKQRKRFNFSFMCWKTSVLWDNQIPEKSACACCVVSKEKVVLDSREKMEFYRTKMQDLVSVAPFYIQMSFYTKADVTIDLMRSQRALADKREERKTELNQVIVKMEQGGSADGILQVRADRIQSDLEELLRALTERCNKHGVQVKSTALIELPLGWQPGIPEISAVWDEDWDKFEDEGFSFDVGVPTNAESASLPKENSSPLDSYSLDSLSNVDGKSEKSFSKVEHESYIHSKDESMKSPQGSPAIQSAFESPSKEYSNNHFRKSFDEDTDTRRYGVDSCLSIVLSIQVPLHWFPYICNCGRSESPILRYRSFDEPTWGTFNNNVDTDSVWGFSKTKFDLVRNLFPSIRILANLIRIMRSKERKTSGDFGMSPTRSESFQGDGIFEKKSDSAFHFEDSFPASPNSRASNSPPRYSVGSGGDSFFDNISSYDSFSHTHERSGSGFSPQRETLTRFDSINSSAGFDQSQRFSFEESDPFGSSGPFKVSSDESSIKGSESSWSAF
ncbi:hypothetical protein LguiA_003563 [Lonicera macranthoides]